MRRYAKDNNIYHNIVSRDVWLIDLDEFIRSVNAKEFDTTIAMPRIRNIRSAAREFKKHYPKEKVDHHTVEFCMQCNTVSKINHGGRWLINYDELEKVILQYIDDKKFLRKFIKEFYI